jgi:hypothetical protein
MFDVKMRAYSEEIRFRAEVSTRYQTRNIAKRSVTKNLRVSWWWYTSLPNSTSKFG